MVNEIAIGLLLTLFGVKATAVHVGAGLVIAMTAGWIVGRLGARKWVEPYVFETTLRAQPVDPLRSLTCDDRVTMGIGLGALIHGWVPTEFFTTYTGAGSAFGVLIAVVIGIPRYPSAAGVVVGYVFNFLLTTSLHSLTHIEITMNIKILGPGCSNCKNLERATREAVAELGLDARIEKVEDYPTIAAYGVMSTPALVVDEEVVLYGRVPKAAEIRGRLAPAMS